MKIRSGFVSNSSSSSFVVVGFQDLVDGEIENKLDKSDYYGNCLYDEDGIFGIMLASISDNESGSVDKDKVFEAFEKMRDLASKLGISEEPKLLIVNSYS